MSLMTSVKCYANNKINRGLEEYFVEGSEKEEEKLGLAWFKPLIAIRPSDGDVTPGGPLMLF